MGDETSERTEVHETTESVETEVEPDGTETVTEETTESHEVTEDSTEE